MDFVLRRGTGHVAIEVKAKAAPSARDLKGLRAIAALPGLQRRVLVFTGQRPFRTDDGIEGMPVVQFVQEVEQGKI